MSLPFDPESQGARKLTTDWFPQLERWTLRVPEGRLYLADDGTRIMSGHVIEVDAGCGRRLVERGYDVLSVARLDTHDAKWR